MRIKLGSTEIKMIKCALIGGIIAFAWATFSWTVIGWQLGSFKQFSNESRVADVIQDNAPESGLYLLPNPYMPGSGSQKAKQKDLMSNGPVMFASVQLQGAGNMKGSFILSILSQVVAAYLILWMLLRTKGLSFKYQVIFITVIGVIVALLGILPHWIWKGFPAGYVFACILDLVIAWFLAGLAMVKMLKFKN